MFDPERYYLTDSPEIAAIWRPQTLACWRHEGRGPAYSKIGKRVVYKGADLLAFIEARRVEPKPDRVTA